MDLVTYFSTHLTPYLRAVFGRGERGAGIIEYALLVGLIAAVCIAAVTFFGHSVDRTFSSAASRTK